MSGGGVRTGKPHGRARPGGRGEGRHKLVTSAGNPIIKDIRALSQKKFRDSSGRFVAEGLQLVRYALDADWPIEIFVYTGAAMSETAVQQAAAASKAAGALLLEVNAAVLSRLSRRDNPQSVIGVFRQAKAPLAEVGRTGLWVALEAVRDPGNLGTIIRTMDAAGGAGVVLVGQCCDPFSPEAVRATMGSVFHVPLAVAPVAAFIKQAKSAHVPMIGAHLTGATDFRDTPYPDPCLVIMGNEQKGLSAPLAAACDKLVQIPMTGQAESLNLAVATGLMIYEARRDHMGHRAGRGRPSQS